MIDPDYPHYGTGQFYLHWLVTNIPVSVVFSWVEITKNGYSFFSFSFIKQQQKKTKHTKLTLQGEWLRQGITYDVGEYIVGKWKKRLYN